MLNLLYWTGDDATDAGAAIIIKFRVYFIPPHVGFTGDYISSAAGLVNVNFLYSRQKNSIKHHTSVLTVTVEASIWVS